MSYDIEKNGNVYKSDKQFQTNVPKKWESIFSILDILTEKLFSNPCTENHHSQESWDIILNPN